MTAQLPTEAELAASRTPLAAAYRWMAVARAMEARLSSAYKQGRLRGRFLSGRGQEAIPVGATLPLGPEDVIAPVHRDLGAHLVRGTTPLTIFRHYLGRATGPSQGRDGDLHMGEWSRHIFPMVSHLPDSWPVMTGVALAARLRREATVVMAFCGDGATSTGTWHEAVNFAAVHQLPMILVVENNQYAYSTPTAAQYRGTSLAARAPGYGIAGVEVDGNDVLAVLAVTETAIERARHGGGPTLVEAHTLRMEGHAFHDAAGYVPAATRTAWAERDPLLLAEAALRAAEGWDDRCFEVLHEAIQVELRRAWDQAESEPLPDASQVAVGVYADTAP